MTQFVRGPNPIWLMVDLTGVVLNDGYYASFLTNDLPYIDQAVYQDPNGVNPWANPIRFQPSGTLSNNIYFDETATYRIEIRQGDADAPSNADPLIWLIENYQVGATSSQANALITANNLITNPQFADIFFVSPHTITTAGTYDIAPGWQLVLTGSGTTVLTQGTNAGNTNIQGNPAFYLGINNTGWTNATLVQRFADNGAIFANGAIAFSTTALATGANQTLSVIYTPSAGGLNVTLLSKTIFTGAFAVYADAVPIGTSVNTDVGEVAFVDIVLNLPVNGNVSLSNMQLVGQSVPLSDSFNNTTDIPLYAEETHERMVDHEFHVYQNSILVQAKNSLLVGWNFPLNPWQFSDPAFNPTATIASYICDQTILVQESASSLLIGRAADFHRQDLEFFAVNGKPDNRFAIVQYIDPRTIQPYWGYLLSSLVRARLFTTQGSDIHLKMRLIYRTDLPPTLSPTEPITGWDADGNVTFAAGWTALSPLNDPAYSLASANIASEGNNAYPAVAYDAFSLPVMATDNMTLGIVLYITDKLNTTLGSVDQIVFDKVSLVANPFAIDTPPQTFDQVLQECRYYYEKSYDNGVLPGTATTTGAMSFEQYALNVGGNNNIYPRIFNLPFKNAKRTNTPAYQFYSPVTGNPAGFRAYLRNNGGAATNADVSLVANWDIFPPISSNNVSFVPKTVAPLISLAGPDLFPEGFLSMHYTIDARLGL